MSPLEPCVFTFVNVDSDMIPRPVPPVYPTTYSEDARYLEAYRRNRKHSARKSARGRYLAQSPGDRKDQSPVS